MPFLLTEHFWAFFFGEPGKHFYEAAVYGNVMAVLPLGVLGAVAFFWHRAEVKALHEIHDSHLKAILSALDPEAESESTLDLIADRVDERSPGGLKTILEAVERKK